MNDEKDFYSDDERDDERALTASGDDGQESIIDAPSAAEMDALGDTVAGVENFALEDGDATNADDPVVETGIDSADPDDAYAYGYGTDFDPAALGEIDLDAAFASVAAFNIDAESDTDDLLASIEADAPRRAQTIYAPSDYVPSLPIPPMVRLRRGNLASLVPALSLIALGSWLTLAWTSDALPNPLLIAGAVIGAILVTLFAAVMSTGRWTRGLTFFAIALLLLVGLAILFIQPLGFDAGRGYPLLLAVPGIALVLSGLLARPVMRRAIFPGVLLLIGAAAGLTVTTDLIPSTVQTFIAPLYAIPLVLLLLIWVLPRIVRRRP